MSFIDPATGQPLPQDAIQRILFVSNAVHVYNIPPMPSNKGYVASAWTEDPARHIFTARLRILETSDDTDSTAAPTSGAGRQGLKVDIVLEDPSSGQLFAAAPYTSPTTVEPVIDSSRFFAITVRDPSGKKAVLGIGFEERSEAFDLGVALQEANRALGWDQKQSDSSSGDKKQKEEVKDYSLKEGETITVNFGGSKFGRRRQREKEEEEMNSQSSDLQSFALPPPPAGASGGFGDGSIGIKPPPSAKDIKERRKSARNLGFDDGQFGEFA